MFAGVESVAVDMKERKITVIGDADPVCVTVKLRKFVFTEVVSVGYEKTPEEKKKEEEDKKKKAEEEKKKKEEEEKKCNFPKIVYSYPNSYEPYPCYRDSCEPYPCYRGL